MSSKEFVRKRKEDRPVVAICYDFDKTLSPDDMQAQGYIQSVGCDVAKFWTESNGLAESNDMDQNLAYMYTMVRKAEGRLIPSRKTLAEYGAKVSLFPGVEGWFERIRSYGEAKGVIVEHYIISSGLKEMIEGTSVAQAGAFEKIYASSFYFNENGVATWPAQVVNFTNKTQFLFRIEKGVLDINDPGVNDPIPPDEIRVPFRNMIYIGDSDTDVPCMKLVRSYGGYSIGVYNSSTQDKAKVYKMMQDGRIGHYAPADYSPDTELERLVKTIIDRTAVNEELESAHYQYKREMVEARKEVDATAQARANLIMALESSENFATTHTIIREMQTLTGWSSEEKEQLFSIAVTNSQVQWILTDSDVAQFYKQLLRGVQALSNDAKEVKDTLEA